MRHVFRSLNFFILPRLGYIVVSIQFVGGENKIHNNKFRNLFEYKKNKLRFQKKKISKKEKQKENYFVSQISIIWRVRFLLG